MSVREVKVSVFLHPGEDPPFHLECPELKLNRDNNHAVFDNDGHDGFLLNYALEEPSHGYFFPDDSSAALWCHKRAECPSSKAQWGQFKAREVMTGNKVLVVRNLNQKGHEGNFSYTLRVTKQPSARDPECLDLDPGGTNNNGNNM